MKRTVHTHLFCCIRLLLAVFFVVRFFDEARAQTPCGMVQEISMATCNRDYDGAIAACEKYQRLFPSDSMRNNIKYFQCYLLMTKRDFSAAKRVIQEILRDTSSGYWSFSEKCPFAYEGTDCRRQITIYERNTEIRYDAAMLLHTVFMEEKSYDSALWILRKANREYTCRVYLPSNCNTRIRERFSATYEKKGEIDSAINILTPYILTEPYFERVLSLLKKYKDINQIRAAYKNITDSLKIEYGVYNLESNPKYEYDQQGGILRVIKSEEYGRKVIWHFLGQEFWVGGANDYKSTRVKGEKKKRKLIPRKTDEELLHEASEWIRQYYVYKMLYGE